MDTASQCVRKQVEAYSLGYLVCCSFGNTCLPMENQLKSLTTHDILIHLLLQGQLSTLINLNSYAIDQETNL